jgi:hypothetical protein
MKRVVLIFTDTSSIAEFILRERVSNAEVDSYEQTLTAIINDSQIKVAEDEYKAILKAMISKN